MGGLALTGEWDATPLVHLSGTGRVVSSGGIHKRSREGFNQLTWWMRFTGKKFILMKTAGTFPTYPKCGAEGLRLSDHRNAGPSTGQLFPQ